MIRFLSGFILGYVVAKRPPTRAEFNEFQNDVRRFFDEFIPPIREATLKKTEKNKDDTHEEKDQ